MNSSARPAETIGQNTAPHTPASPSRGSVSGLIDRLCDQFELSWQQGRRPQIETFLEGTDSALRGPLLQELILLDLEYRGRSGEIFDREEYHRRFRADAAHVAQAFERTTGDVTQMLPPPEQKHSPKTITAAVRYRDLQFHAEGGLGEVYRAVDEDLRRQVAVKFIKARHVSDTECRSRFLVEAEVTGRLDHPGVAPVYAMGEGWDGRPFYTMRFIEGGTLRQAIEEFHKADWKVRGARDRRIELHRLVSHLVSACNTVAYAHNRGIVHRDIKPENIMIGRFRETLVVDWGLAVTVLRDERAKASGEKTLMVGGDCDSSSSVSGAGTIGYASPEQLSLSSHPVSPVSDVYSLGATLYKLICGAAPFHGRPNQQVLEGIRSGTFPTPRQVHGLAPRALESICLKAMATDPGARYATALEMADDLQAWLSDEPVPVYREPIYERIVRSARRNRAWTTAIVAASVILVGGATISAWWLSRSADREHTALIVARQAKQDSIRVAAKFAARTLASEIDLRWRILEQEVADGELRSLLEAAADKAPGTPERDALQRWLESRHNRYKTTTRYDSWTLTDATGVQLAREPYSDETVGKNFAHRDYFHGQGKDLTAEAKVGEIKPLNEVHRSIVYKSNDNDEFKVAFAVPVWDSRSTTTRKPMAVLTMSVTLGDFDVLKTDLSKDHIAVLVETRPYDISGHQAEGLILQHPELTRQMNEDGRQPLASISPATLKSMERLLRLRLREGTGNGSAAGKTDVQNLEVAYHDPLDHNADNPWLAAFEPVLVPGRSEKIRNTGWFVLIQQREDTSPDAAPAK